MAVTFDENGVTIVGNMVMVSGTYTAVGDTNIIDVSPYMKEIYQVFHNSDLTMAAFMFGKPGGFDTEDAIEVQAVDFMEITSDTTAQIFASKTGEEDFTRTATTGAGGKFVVLGRK